MRIVNFVIDGVTRFGVLRDESVIDPLRAAAAEERAWFADTVSFIRAGAPARQALDKIVSQSDAKANLKLRDVKLTAPMMPSTILCSGSNYRAHNAEKANTAISGKEPEFFIKTSDCVIGPDDAILYDAALSKKIDCETELAVVIGKAGRHIPVERALEHVFGYTIVNDVTARDRQVRMKDGFVWYELGRSKAFETSAPLGPCITTADEIGDPQALMLKTRINGELRQSSTTAEMIWSCAELIHFFSVNFTLKPGMMIITGTPAGTAWSTDAELGGKWSPTPGLVSATRYCQPGDVIESEVEKIGILRNTVAASR
ncbi:MAG TPA: fumarylacetoacetate hydrolase family protein [Beijerinckiaceae bacterium]|nr:fumarylacetoacetate hydrolase family protein [Beijerinckiaceae bacterium]